MTRKTIKWKNTYKWLITGIETSLTWRVPLVEQELVTLLDNLSSYPVISGVGITRSLVLCVMFCRSLFVLCPFPFDHCVVCPFTDSDCPFVIFKLFFFFSDKYYNVAWQMKLIYLMALLLFSLLIFLKYMAI